MGEFGRQHNVVQSVISKRTNNSKTEKPRSRGTSASRGAGGSSKNKKKDKKKSIFGELFNKQNFSCSSTCGDVYDPHILSQQAQQQKERTTPTSKTSKKTEKKKTK